MTTTFKVPAPDVTVRPGYFAYSEAVFEQALRDVLEQAALVCDALQEGPWADVETPTAGDAADAIRAMKEQIK